VQQKLLALAIAIAAAVIVVGVGLGWENNKVVPVNPTASAHYLQEPHNHLGFMSDWDGPTYLAIAKHGYTNPIQANFFPLYPLLVHVINGVVPSLVDSGLIVSWLCFVGAIYFYLRIIKLLYGTKDDLEALRGTMFFVLFPTGVFLIATYTESLFAFLALGALYYALRKNYLAAGLLAMVSTATHINGLFVVVLIGLVLLEEGVGAAKTAATILIGSLGLAAYMVFQAKVFHNPLAFLDAQKAHSWLNFGLGHFITELATLNGVFLVLLLVSTVYWWQRRRSFSVYSLLYAAIVLLGGRDLSGLGRYSLMAFPLQFMAYDYLRDRKLGYALAIAMAGVLWTFFTLRYAGGYTGG
jgi:hypothetical protein